MQYTFWIDTNPSIYFRMASQENGGQVPCEYVYDEDKNNPPQETIIFEGEYSDEDSEKDSKVPENELDSTIIEKSRPSKTKRRVSRYDSGNYALPDSDDEAEMVTLRARLKAKDAQLAAQKTRSVTWRRTSFIFMFLLLFSVTGNVYQAIEKSSSSGKKSTAIPKQIYRLRKNNVLDRHDIYIEQCLLF